MCLSIPALFTQRLTDLQQLSYEGRLKMRASLLPSAGGSPTSERRPSLSGMTFGLVLLKF